MNLKSLFLSLLLAFLSVSSYANKHYLVFIHGIASDEGTFASGQVALPNYLNNIQNEVQYVSTSFGYPTGKDQYDTFDFAKMLEDFMAKLPLEKNDKFSFICHSQGGLVAMNWLRFNYSNDGLGIFKSKEIIEHQMDKMATFGTPYFGTQIVRVPLYLKKLKDFIFGKKELRDMMFGSQMLTNLRDTFFYDENFKKFISHIKLLNISGNFQLAKTSSLSFMLEDDLAVPVPSASLNFDHYIDRSLPDPFSPNKKLKHFEHHNVRTFTLARPHISLTKRGLVKVPKECITDFSCDHEGFQVMSHFFSDNMDGLNIDFYEPESFYVHLRLHIPKTSRYTILKDKDDYDITLNPVLGDNRLIAGDPFFFNVETKALQNDDKGHVDIILAGKLKHEQQRNVVLSVRVRGAYLKREIPITVKRGRPVVVDLNLYGLSDYYPRF